jgi:hypothetical protein
MTEHIPSEPVHLYSLEDEEERSRPLVIINESIWSANSSGMWSFILMIVGVITSIVPLMGFIAFFVLPVSFVLGVVSLIRKRKPKWPAILGILGSVVTTLINAIFLIFYLALGLTALWGIFSGLPELISQF